MYFDTIVNIFVVRKYLRTTQMLSTTHRETRSRERGDCETEHGWSITVAKCQVREILADVLIWLFSIMAAGSWNVHAWLESTYVFIQRAVFSIYRASPF